MVIVVVEGMRRPTCAAGFCLNWARRGHPILIRDRHFRQELFFLFLFPLTFLYESVLFRNAMALHPGFSKGG